MINKIARNYSIGGGLIVFGVIILLNNLGFISIGFQEIFWPFIAITGLLMVIKGYETQRNGKIFWGTLLFLFGVFSFIRTFDSVVIPEPIFISAIFFIFGTAFLMLYFNNIREWFLLFYVFVLYLLFGAFCLSYYGFFESIDFFEYLRLFWPIILILIGLGIILKYRHKTNSKSVSN